MKRLFSLLLVVCLIVAISPLTVSAATVASGTYGAVKWKLDNNGKLTITGTGQIAATGTVPATSNEPWLDYKDSIKSVVVGEGITGLSSGVFYNCNYLTDVTLPSTLEVIKSSAFYRCWSLTELEIPASVTTIEASAFSQTAFREITIPEKVQTISNALFHGCDNLTSVTFKGPIANIGDNAFYSCDSLTEVNFEKGLTGKIGDHAFAYCSSLESFDVPSGVTCIMDHAFDTCSSLSAVTFPESLESIWSCAFFNTPLVSVTIPKTVDYIGQQVFSSCDSLKDMTIYTATVEGLDGLLVVGDVLEYVHVIGDAPEFEKDCFASDYEDFVVYYDEGTSGWTPPMWNGYLIECWGQTDFTKTGTYGEALTWVLRDGTLTISGTGPMDDNSSQEAPWFIYEHRINHVVIEEGVTSIGKWAFYKMEHMVSVSIPSTVESIGAYSFEFCYGLKEVTLPDGVVSIGNTAFRHCSALTAVTMADSVETLGNDIFTGCSQLTYVKLPSNMTEIPQSMFDGCTKLAQVEIPDTVTSIGNSAFDGCFALRELEIPEGVTTIGSSALGSTGLVDITIPASVTSLGTNLFYNCPSLEYVRFIGDAPTIEGYAFREVTTTCTYPADNETWTADVLKDYGGTITWEPDCNNHQYASIVTAPTCTEQGYTTHTCTLCNDSYVDTYTDALGHSYGEWTVIQAAACTMDGTKRKECANCDHYADETIPSIGHSYESVVTAPTCTEGGYTTHTCTICGESYSDNPVEPLGHSWDDETAVVKNCTVCGFRFEGYEITLDIGEVWEASSVWIDGAEYLVTSDGSQLHVLLEQTDATNLVIYTYNDPNAEDVHTQYPTGMKVWMLKFENDAYTATYVPEFDDLLQYSGSSIRIKGVKGIRMITSVPSSAKQALTGKGLAGYTLVEYGTALAWASDLEGGNPLVLGQSYTKSNYAYKKGVADPVFKNTGTLIQYTNVLVGFDDDQCIPDIAMRPYIIVEDAEGNQITIYGGMLYRSIGYIAYQNRNAFKPGSGSYEYVWGIIHHVYGDQYDADYKG